MDLSLSAIPTSSGKDFGIQTAISRRSVSVIAHTMSSTRFWRDSGLSFEQAAVGSWIAVGAKQEVVMAKVIEFYVPKNFRKPSQYAPALQCGKIIEFCSPTKKSA